jgi:hypothetical protein
MTTLNQKITHTEKSVTVGNHTFKYDTVTVQRLYGRSYIVCMIGGVMEDRFLTD